MSETPPSKPPRPSRRGKPALPDEAGVIAWLDLNPGFFAHHPELLERLHVPHVSGASVVSLVEARMALQRERIQALEAELDEILQIAHDNDGLMRRMSRLTLDLLGATASAGVLESIGRALGEGFAFDRYALSLNYPADAGDPPWRLCLDDAADALFAPLIARGQPRCGYLPEAMRLALFGEAEAEIRSAALVPLKQGGLHGVLALGSRDARRFHPGMGLDFLRQLGTVVAVRLAAVQGLAES